MSGEVPPRPELLRLRVQAAGARRRALKNPRPAATRREIDGFLEPFQALPFDHGAAAAYARTRLALERKGRPIGERDLMIASIALARDLVVVTHNTSEFARVPDLASEDWL